MRPCTVHGCTDEYMGKGLCEKHYHIDYAAKNQEALKQHRKANYSKLRAYSIQWRKENPDKVTAWGARPKVRFKCGMQGAKKRDIPWELTLSQWTTLTALDKCHYCISPLNKTGCGLDRIKNDIGYTIDNVVPCCWECNAIKGDRLTYEEMMLVAKVLVEFRGKNGIRP